MAEKNDLMEKIVSLCKRRGFVFQGSEIYGGLAGTWDYGPLGVLLKDNIKQIWRSRFIDLKNVYPIDAAILMNSKVWEASGHISGFSDPLVECQKCYSKFRVDQIPDFSAKDYAVVQKEMRLRFEEPLSSLVEEITKLLESTGEKIKRALTIKTFLDSESLGEEQEAVFREVGVRIIEEADALLAEGKGKLAVIEDLRKILEQSNKYIGYVTQQYLNRFIVCPVCSSRGNWGAPRQFNMMFKTHAGAIDDELSVVYLRPETAGGMFVNFKNIIDSLHPKLPFGLGQIGKAFRNEIAPRDFIFRLRELEQMEVEYFVKPTDWERAFEDWRVTMHDFAKEIGLLADSVHELEVGDIDRAHYSKRTIDFEFDFPFGRKELWGLAYRTDFDLSAHAEASGVDLSYLDEGTKERFIPHVIEPSLGVDRTLLAVLASAYREDEMGGEKRVYLALSPKVAPFKAMVSPLLKNKPELVARAMEVREMLQKKVHPWIVWDDNGNIGKRYRRQDEIGTPFCITVDFDTLGENPELKDTVTVRERDTGEQTRVAVADLPALLKDKLSA
jgi:glycyl-tRNA synthetase